MKLLVPEKTQITLAIAVVIMATCLVLLGYDQTIVNLSAGVLLSITLSCLERRRGTNWKSILIMSAIIVGLSIISILGGFATSLLR